MMAKLNFQHHYSSLQCPSESILFAAQETCIFLLLSMLKTVVLLYISLKIATVDQFNAPLLNKSIDLWFSIKKIKK